VHAAAAAAADALLGGRRQHAHRFVHVLLHVRAVRVQIGQLTSAAT
jgi:hypothetical protein